MNNLILVIFDSARFDHVKMAKAPWLRRLGKLERRFSYASWTSPSHYAYLMGLLPHTSPARVFASRSYEKELNLWNERLGIRKLSFKAFLPELSLPRALKANGYETHAFVSMPVLNPSTAVAAHFDSYVLMPRHNDFGAMIDRLGFSARKPRFFLLNVGETHYPYAVAGESEFPRLRGLHGVFRHMGDVAAGSGRGPAARFFSARELKLLKSRQIECVEHLDRLLERLYAKCPANTHIIVTSDHGELFGEDGYFGHGPIFHEKVFEVPFVSGVVPR